MRRKRVKERKERMKEPRKQGEEKDRERGID
jgi:hypothetical protein